MSVLLPFHNLFTSRFRSREKRIVTFLFLLLSLLVPLFLKADVPPTPSSTPTTAPAAGPKPDKGDWLVYSIASDIDTLNPIVCDDAQGADINSYIFEGLNTRDYATGKIVPCLATSWEISPDKLTYTFHLRKDVMWEDGKPFTADDVKYTFDRILDPTCDTAPLRTYLEIIKSCQVIDPYTIRFVADHPYFKIVENLGFPIIPKHVYDDGNPFNDHPASRKPIGTGPYRLVTWTTGARIILERKDNYWGDPHYLKRLVFEIISEPFIAIQLLKKGEVDFDTLPAILWRRQLEKSPAMARLTKNLYAEPAYSYLGFNLRDPLFSDKQVREAIDHLIPRDQILHDIFLDQFAIKTSGDMCPSDPGYNQQVLPTSYDPPLARQLLRNAGWALGSDGFLHKGSLRLSFSALIPAGSMSAPKIAELIQENLAKEGIEMKIQLVQFTQLYKLVNEWNFQAIFGGWTAALDGDPYQLWHSSQADVKKSSDFIGYKSPEADKLIEAIREEYDPEKRALLNQQLHLLLHNDYPCCFLFSPREIEVYSKRFQTVPTYNGHSEYSRWWVPKNQQIYTELGQ